ncbi:MAG: family efflux transporter [Gemmataceae bacterium]|nr:family efflux transporter [Gemmataceae bacterium]
MGAQTLEIPTELAPHAANPDRTQLLLEGPVLRTLLRLAAPTVALMTFQAVVNAAEGYFVGFLGSDALAGISLSFPLVMLMTTLSAGAYGGGVAAAVARALGAGRREEAARLAGTALAVAALLGVGFTAGMLAFGREIYAALGATGPALAAAVRYSDVLFLGAVPFWVFQAASSCLRGSGNTAYPAVVGAAGGVVTLAVSPLLIFGAGPLPGLGLAGAAWAMAGYNLASAVLLVRALRAPGSPFRSAFAALRPDRRRTAAILSVAVPSALNTVQSNLTFLALTALVAPFGTAAIAGYGMGGRLEYLLIPVVFGVGSALVPLVGANSGAGNHARVRQATRAGLLLGAGAGAAVGLAAAAFPDGWMGLFTAEPGVLTTGRSYLRTVGPAYIGFGGGLALFFAAQGTGRVLQPLAAGFTRLTVAAAGGHLAVRVFGRGLDPLFVVMAAGLVVYGLVMVVVARRELGLSSLSEPGDGNRTASGPTGPPAAGPDR